MKKEFKRANIQAFPKDLSAKWGTDVLSEGFVPFPKKLLRTMGAFFEGGSDLEDLAVLLAVVDFKRSDLFRNPSTDYLGFLAGLTQAKVEASLKRMESKGFVEVKIDDQGGCEVDHYKLLKMIVLQAEINE